MSISVSNVVKLYGNQKALDRVSFEVRPGEIAGFLGPNGAGKSTMMKIISTYLPQNEGSVEVCGLNVLNQDLEIRKILGYLPENNPLYHDMYVREYLRFVGGLYRLKNLKTRIDEIIYLVGLTKEQNKLISALSKGFRQRVGLAQSFIHDPRVLILDEPTTGLDPNQIQEIRSLIREIGKNKTVMLSTHIMQEVEAICDRAIIIDEGRIVADKAIDQLKSAAGGDRRLHVEFKSEITAGEIKAFMKDIEIEQLSPVKYEISHSDIQLAKNRIMQMAIEKNLEILNFSESGKSLEEIFRELTLKT